MAWRYLSGEIYHLLPNPNVLVAVIKDMAAVKLLQQNLNCEC